MPYAEGRTFYDADSHIMETRDWLASYAEAKTAERFLPVMGEKFSGDDIERILTHIDQCVGEWEQRKSDTSLAAEAEAKLLENKGWRAIGAFDPSERVRALDLFGFTGQLVFGSGAYAQFLYNDDAAVVYGGARAFNRGITEFCSVDPERLMAVGVVPMSDPTESIKVTDEAITLGCKALCMPVGPARGISPSHPEFEGVWARLEEAGVPFMFHLSVGTTPDSARSLPAGFKNNGRPKTAFPLGGEKMRAMDFLTIPSHPQLMLAELVLGGVLEQFPDLRGGVIEQGAMWVVPWMYWLDAAGLGFRRHEPYLSKLTMKPSDYLRRQVKFSPFFGEPVKWMIEQAGAELFMFNTDFPHPEGGRDPLGKFEAALGDVGEDTRERFFAGNFREMMGLRAA